MQCLYAWELQDRPVVAGVADRLRQLGRGKVREAEQAERLAAAIIERVDQLDEAIAATSEGWPLDRIGVVERNILRIGLFELLHADVPPRVAIDEAVRLAHWFAGPKAPAFVNGVMDGLARRHGVL